MKASLNYYLGKIIGKIVSTFLLYSEQDQLTAFFKSNIAVRKTPDARRLYYACTNAQIEFLRYNNIDNSILLRTKDGVRLLTDKNFMVLVEVFCNNIYSAYRDYIMDEYVIFDIGANRGYSALFFAKDDNCKHVLSFEPDKETMEYFRKNMALNPRLKSKIIPHNYGLFDETKQLLFYKTKDGSDWVTTHNLDFANSYWSEKRKSMIVENKLEVRKASTALKDLMLDHKLASITKVIKIDIEGAEYEVLGELKEGKVLGSFSAIFGEAHLGMDRIIEICEEDFELVHLEAESIKGCFGFLFVNRNLLK